MQKNVTSGRRKGCPNYPPEFKQQLIVASCEPGVSISKLALENGINANLLFKWRQQWREGKLLLPSSESPLLLPVTLDATAVQPEPPAEDPKLSISCEVNFRHRTLHLNGTVSEKLLTLLIQELKR
ncbi:TPA: IS66-like element accessory protein TnpA [Citrobacter freundii]|uniref:IS66-like element accessory protein TnpA n=1 Tax=Enterobacteriaceae TaxID=543 RepID=UPI0012B93075|nr:transposase [Klebsiella grimontii]EKN3732795.1 transposase [Yersinia enterocolitica]